ncbi:MULTISPECIES: hypothetical protein [Nocardia]|uniref:Uncharacterized protein n=1 Tax=Nocardia nova TaxID=37330 RepID=A0A2T2Z1D9_9NOCA|nr:MULTISPECIES: hypothetical protein [Nocardia]PSR61563.1 hypothetical protein C8259_18600 [Nocardia nova]
MTNPSASEPINVEETIKSGEESIESAEETIKSGEELLATGQTESLIAQAEETIERARALGRPDIVAQAQAVIANLTEKHNTLVENRADLVEKNQVLIDAVDDLKAAKKNYDEVRSNIDRSAAES